MTPPRLTQAQRSRRRAFSLVEAVMATLIVSILTVAALNAIPPVIEGRLRNERMAEATLLAGALLAEIEQLPWEDPDAPGGPIGPEGATSRDQFNDLDDYHVWAESPPQDRDGANLEGYENWSREVSVEFVPPSAPDTATTARTSVKRITVLVRFRGVVIGRAVRLRSSAWDDAIPDPVFDEPALTQAPLGADTP